MNHTYDSVARKNCKAKLLEAFGKRCVRCGYNKCGAALEFHHIDKTIKSFSIGDALTKHMAWNRIIAEAKKCILLCSNCHKELHAKLWALSDLSLPGPVLVEKSSEVIPKAYCVVCAKPIYNKCQYCSRTCMGLAKRKAVRPGRQELQTLIENNTWCALGRLFGVSDNTVRKWARLCGITNTANEEAGVTGTLSKC